MDDKPNENFTPEFDIDQPEMSRRSVLAGTAGLGLISRYMPEKAPNNVNPPQGKPVDIGSRLELFVDDYLIDEMDGVSQHLHSPDPQDVSIVFDEPWEGDGSAYATVFWDDEIERYRMYYRGTTIGETQYTCYAESEEGSTGRSRVSGSSNTKGRQTTTSSGTGGQTPTTWHRSKTRIRTPIPTPSTRHSQELVRAMRSSHQTESTGSASRTHRC
jgi:hypothetical protein